MGVCKKHIIAMGITVASVFMMFTGTANAAQIKEESSVGGYTYDLEAENSDISYEEIEENINEEIESQDESKVEKSLRDTSFDIDEYDVDGAYIEYLLSDMLITNYYNNTSFKSLLSDDYRLKVPYVTDEGEEGVIVYKKDENGQLEIVAETLLGDAQSVYVTPEKIEDIINKNIDEEVEELLYTYSDRYFMTIVYVKTASQEYLIPFAEEGTTNMKNGSVYSVNDFFKKMNKIFDESTLEKNGNLNGGLPYRENRVNVGVIVAVLIAGLLCVVSVIGLVKIKKIR